MSAKLRFLQLRRPRVRPRRILVEQLEDRTVLAAAPVPPGLVSWYRAEGDATDYVSGNNGVLQNGVTFTAGEVGQAFQFDGVDDEVRIPASTSLNVGLSSGLTV